jgi:hypothetical protein
MRGLRHFELAAALQNRCAVLEADGTWGNNRHENS